MGAMAARERIDMEKIQLSYGILAGGRSRRMGSDKASLKINGESFLKHLASEFHDKGELIVSVRDEEQGQSTGLSYIIDEHQDAGPLEGVRQLLACSPTEYMFICACDVPYVKYEMAEYLSQVLLNGDDCCAFWDGKRVHPLTAIYSRHLHETARQMIVQGCHRVMPLLEQSKTRIIDIRETNIPLEWLQNINTKESYARIRQ